MLTFQFREEPCIILRKEKANPQKIGEAIQRHAQANGGQIRTRKLLDEARSKKHPMYQHIEWRDNIAAQRYRLDQVRELIRIVRVVDSETPDEPPRRAFLNLNDGRNGHSYRTIADVLNSADLQVKVLDAAERDLAAFQSRYDEILEICDLIKEARDRLRRKRESMEAESGKGRRA